MSLPLMPVYLGSVFSESFPSLNLTPCSFSLVLATHRGVVTKTFATPETKVYDYRTKEVFNRTLHVLYGHVFC